MINPFNRQAVRERNVRMFENGNPIARAGHLGIHPSKWHAATDKVNAICDPIFYGMIGAILVGVIAGAAQAAPEFPSYDQECRIELQRLVCN